MKSVICLILASAAAAAADGFPRRWRAASGCPLDDAAAVPEACTLRHGKPLTDLGLEDIALDADGLAFKTIVPRDVSPAPAVGGGGARVCERDALGPGVVCLRRPAA